MSNKNIPTFLYRFFDKEEYATAFVERGEFRMLTTEYCRKIECALRRDELEGIASYKKKSECASLEITDYSNGYSEVKSQPGLIHCEHRTWNEVLIFSCSSSDVNVEKIRNKFGKHVVKISDPVQLMRDLEGYFLRKNLKLAGPIELKQVIYDKGEVINDDHDDHEMVVARKSKEFSEECEWRFVITLDWQQNIEVDALPVLLYEKPNYLEYIKD